MTFDRVWPILAGGIVGTIAVGLLLDLSTPPNSSLEQIRAASFVVYVEGYGGVCSGQFIDTNTLLTANHCFNESYDYYILVDGDKVPLELNTNSPLYDTVTFDVPAGWSFPYVVVAPEDTTLTVGQDVLGGQFPQALGLFYFSEGIANDIQTGVFNLNETVAVTMPTLPGSSGSGLYIQQGSGYVLVGTLTGGMGESFNNYSVTEGIYAVWN